MPEPTLTCKGLLHKLFYTPSSEVKKTKLQAPLLIEQKKIGSFFSALDRRIILADKKLATLQTIKKGMLQKIFSQELRFRDDDGNEFPAWTEKPLGDIASVTKLAGFEFTKYVTYKDEGKIIALRGLNVKNGSLVLDDVKYIDGSDFSKLKRSKLYKGDILFTYVGTIGESAIVDKNDAYYLAPNVALIRIAHESPQYALFYMQSEQFHIELNTQTSHTENIPYALKIQHELDVKIHSCTPLPIQMAHPKSGQVAHETLR